MFRRLFQASLISCVSTALIAQQTPTTTTSAPLAQSSNNPTLTAAPTSNTLSDGTPVRLRLAQTISSATATTGQGVSFEVLEDVKVNGVVVISRGSSAIGTVTDASSKKSMGRGGKLDMSITHTWLADQEKIALRAVKDSKAGGHTGAMVGAMVATSLIVWPAAPLFLFMHGKDITIPQGTEITAFVDGDMHLDLARFGASPQIVLATNVAPISSAQANLEVGSAPPGADIEVDGAFVGNTPSTITVAPGSHQVTVKKKGFIDWTKTLNVTGGTIHLNAELNQQQGAQ